MVGEGGRKREIDKKKVRGERHKREDGAYRRVREREHKIVPIDTIVQQTQLYGVDTRGLLALWREV